MELLSRFYTAYCFVSSILPRLRQFKLITAGLVKYLAPLFAMNLDIRCSSHIMEAQNLEKSRKRKNKSNVKDVKLKKVGVYLRKFISPLVTNRCKFTNDKVDKVKISSVPKSRKVLKL